MSTTPNYVPPGQQRSLRACMVCSIVMTRDVCPTLPFTLFSLTLNFQRFYSQGCPNCEEYLQLRGSTDTIAECTSQVFEGLITLANPKKSWVAKWQRLDNYVPGVYATKVSGVLSEDMVYTIENEGGVRYIP